MPDSSRHRYLLSVGEIQKTPTFHTLLPTAEAATEAGRGAHLECGHPVWWQVLDLDTLEIVADSERA